MAGCSERLLRAGPAWRRDTGAANIYDRVGGLGRRCGCGCGTTAPPGCGHGGPVHRVHLRYVEPVAYEPLGAVAIPGMRTCLAKPLRAVGTVLRHAALLALAFLRLSQLLCQLSVSVRPGCLQVRPPAPSRWSPACPWGAPA